MTLRWFFCFAVVLAVFTIPSVVHAAPYASGITNNGSTVTFLLNEPADSLTYSVNGGPVQVLDHTTKGLKSFSVGSASDTFEIFAEKDALTGYSIPTGGTVANHGSGLTQTSNEAGLSVISDDSSIITRFFNQRGIDTSNNPNAPNFGNVFVSIGGTTDPTTIVDPPRTITRGIYALGADGSDILGQGDTGKNPPLPDTLPAFAAGQSNSPFRVHVADNGELYVADFSDLQGNLFRLSSNLSTAINVFKDFGGPTVLPAGRNHGSVTAAWVEGSVAGGDLTVWTMDEDLTTNYVTGAGSTTDKNSIWRYDVGNVSVDYAGLPTKVFGPTIVNNIVDLDRGADGKFYVSQNRSAGTDQASVFVTDAAGAELWNSLAASRTLLANPTAADILTNALGGIAVSPDQLWMATMLNNSHIAVVPLVDGLPDLANRMVINTGTPVNSGRGITFDAAGNIHYVSSGQARYRQLSPGGHTLTTLSWDGSSFDFDLETILDPGGLLGDFNEDGAVNAADFITWRKNDGPNAALPNDNGVATQAERYTLWTTHFGEIPAGSGGGTGQVPEPATVALVMVSLMSIAIIRRPRR